ncbi:hypothetical protein TNIN_490891 [Trichonephila inaurata madagascariensis]|uniref:Uncharacterized protein n=1 Tax=Trichonephila inaurata madagascariensis TaxID=2747483 RepID=A0A8X6YA81_9ARAC|nr:hypothetical protein TNIN_490891 [Trichonephila inaurata madagascariensis]
MAVTAHKHGPSTPKQFKLMLSGSMGMENAFFFREPTRSLYIYGQDSEQHSLHLNIVNDRVHSFDLYNVPLITFNRATHFAHLVSNWFEKH